LATSTLVVRTALLPGWQYLPGSGKEKVQLRATEEFWAVYYKVLPGRGPARSRIGNEEYQKVPLHSLAWMVHV
jgi:hypothetical protein